MNEPKVGDSVEFPPTSIKGRVYAVHDGYFRATSEGGSDIIYTERLHKLSIASGISQYNKYNVSAKVVVGLPVVAK